MSFIKNMQDKILGREAGRQPASPSMALTEDQVRDALRVVIDPDLHRDIVSLGFVKKVEINGSEVAVDVELTTPACPVKEQLKAQCVAAIEAIPAVTKAQVTMTAATRGSVGARPAGISESLGQVKNIIAVASGKGGVGKSTTAVNLAYALARSGSKVGILDADVYGPSVPQMTGVGKPAGMQGQMVVPPEANGVKVISVAMFASAGQASILRGPMAAQIIKQFLTQIAWGELDYLIIDYPPGTGDIQLTLSQVAPITGAVVVTTPQEVALIDVRKAISMFGTLKVPVLGVIETMSYFVCDGCEKKHHIFREGGGSRVAGENGIPLLGEIPIDARVTSESDEGTPPVVSLPESVASRAYVEAAGRVAAQVSILHAKDDGALSQFSLEWK